MLHAALQDLVIVLAASLLAVFSLRQLRLPEAIGFILTGMLIGPGGLGLIADREMIETLAEVGVILLLFTVGMKLSLSELWRMRVAALGLGSLQVFGTTLVVTLIALGLGASGSEAAVWGGLVALSSTVLVVSLYERAGTVATLEGRSAIGVLLFQDLAVVPFLLGLPVLAGENAALGRELGTFALKSVIVIAGTLVGARWVFPRLAERIVATRSRELFTLFTLLTVFAIASGVNALGLSMALGAFLAGVVVSESEYSYQGLGAITPLRDAFNGLFFVSIGMLVAPELWLQKPLLMLGLFLGILVVKLVLITGLGLVLRYTLGSALTIGATLAHIGEFSFIMAQESARFGLLDPESHQFFLSVAVPTMLLTPFAFELTPRAYRRLTRSRWFHRLVGKQSNPLAKLAAEAGDDLPLRDHVIIVGYGVNGRNVARGLRALDTPYLVLELNPLTVRQRRAEGEHIVYGDACRQAVLEHMGIRTAAGLVVAIPDAASARQVVTLAKWLNPQLKVVVRTAFVGQVSALYKLGADEVVPGEFETSLELLGRVMALYGAPPRVIEREKSALRDEQYAVFREGRRPTNVSPLRSILNHSEMCEVALPANAYAQGRTLRELGIREHTGATVIGIQRDGRMLANPSGNTQLQADDVIHLFGSGADFEAARHLLRHGQPDGGSEAFG